MKLFQKGWNFLQDGPGNRLVYHMQGCNMRCPWCSNPEGLPQDGALIVNVKHLVDSVCPYGAVKNGAINRSRCVACQTRECVTRNKTRGIMLSCFEMTPAEIAAEAVAARHLFHDGGGVTFSGGEPLFQFAGRGGGQNKYPDLFISHEELKGFFDYQNFIIFMLFMVNN